MSPSSVEQLSRMNTKKKCPLLIASKEELNWFMELVHTTHEYTVAYCSHIQSTAFSQQSSLSLLSIRPCVSIEPCDKLGGYIGSMIELMTSLPPLLCVPINWHVDLRSAGGQEDHVNHNVVPWEGQSSRRCEGNKMESVF